MAISDVGQGILMKPLSPEILLVISLGIGLVPVAIAVGTCYLKFSIVLSILRSRFGTQQAPSASLVMALSMLMSLTVMTPIVNEVAERVRAVKIGEVSGRSIGEVIDQGVFAAGPWRRFLIAHSGERELRAFVEIAQRQDLSQYEGPRDIGHVIALGAFVLSEIKKGFVIAFLLLLPFFVIDVVIANVLVAMGLTMMSPSTVSLPLKLLLFVSSDGWLHLTQSLMSAYR